MIKLKPGHRTTELGSALSGAALIVMAENVIGRPLTDAEIFGVVTLGVAYTAARAVAKLAVLLGQKPTAEQSQGAAAVPPAKP